MVLINDKKFACATCIKGHRVSGCTHTDRPLFEVKKKGRPSTQCAHCKDKRKGMPGGSQGGSVHTKCVCADPKPPEVILPGHDQPISGARTPSSSGDSPKFGDIMETKKGQPGSKPDFPNGLRDVHDMAAAAEALSDFAKDQQLQMAQRQVANLLNPCHCKTNGICRCCEPKRDKSREKDAAPPSSGSPVGSSGARTPVGSSGARSSLTDGFIEMFQSKASTNVDNHPSVSPTSPSNSRQGPTWAQLMLMNEDLVSPEHKHHPSHTSPHVHKTKLYSPYTPPAGHSGHSTPRHLSSLRRESSESSPPSHTGQIGWASSSTHKNPPLPRLKPIADMNHFLGAVFNEDGTVAHQIPRSALGLPGIKVFDNMAEQGGVKIEPAELMEVDAPVSFPTQDDVVIAACMCGDDCDCPGCAIHGSSQTSAGTDHSASTHGHRHEGACGEGCKSSFDCSDHLSLPRGISSIGHLLSIAAANVPPPARHRPHDLNAKAHDTNILPPSAQASEDAARSCGVVSLKRLQCCNGRCQCPPGQCTCQKECCGCCIECRCDEEGDDRMESGSQTQGSCCATNTNNVPTITTPDEVMSVSSDPLNPTRPPLSIVSPTPVPASQVPVQNLLSPDSAIAQNANHQQYQNFSSSSSSPLDPASESIVAGPSTLRRTSSASKHPAGSGAAALGRRATVGHHSTGSNTPVGRSASTGKAASKSLALHQQPHHPHSHPRPPHTSSNSDPSSHAHPHPHPHGHNHSQGHSHHSPTHRSPSESRKRSNAGSRGHSPQPSSLAHPNYATLGSGPQRDTGNTSGQPTMSLPTLPGQSQPTGYTSPPKESPLKGFSLGNFHNDSEFMAYINKLTSGSTASDNSFDASSAILAAAFNNNAKDQSNMANAQSSKTTNAGPATMPNLTANQGNNPMPNMPNFNDFTNNQPDQNLPAMSEQEVYEMIARMMNEQSSINSNSTETNNNTQPAALPGPGLAEPNFATLSNNNSNNKDDSFDFLSQLNASPPSERQQQSTQRITQHLSNVGMPFGVHDYITPHYPDVALGSGVPPVVEPTYQSLPPSSTAFLQDLFAAQSNPNTTAIPGNQQDNPNRRNSLSNFVDLSKPLSANDVERILRALQGQQQSQNQDQPSTVQNVQNQMQNNSMPQQNGQTIPQQSPDDGINPEDLQYVHSLFNMYQPVDNNPVVLPEVGSTVQANLGMQNNGNNGNTMQTDLSNGDNTQNGGMNAASPSLEDIIATLFTNSKPTPDSNTDQSPNTGQNVNPPKQGNPTNGFNSNGDMASQVQYLRDVQEQWLAASREQGAGI